MRLLSEAALRTVLTPALAVESSARAFIALSSGTMVVPVRSEIQRPDGEGIVFAMPGFLSGEVFGLKLIATRGADSTAMVMLFDANSLAPLGLLSADALTDWRTGGGIAAATRLLARPEATTHVVIGAGRLAGPCAHAVAAVRRIGRTVILGRDARRAEALVARLRAEGLPAEVTTDRAVVAEADIVTTVTNAEAPVFPGAALRPGTHVNLGGAFRPDTREADDVLAARGLFWCDSESACLARAGDLVLPLASGALDRARVVGEIGAALAGTLRGRHDAEEITVFKSLGNAAQDICLASDALAVPGLAAPYFDPKGNASVE
ncbi:ornithine cyclodeaminase family protein [Falsiroseomonas sp. E2-1-a20]|uniref:ornithine cyclodeaminase family protein n=1 Tax=Falsiroseomonas sp. E2-1-a20 TaxID=3239300 RepID=UPI003F2D0AF5